MWSWRGIRCMFETRFITAVMHRKTAFSTLRWARGCLSTSATDNTSLKCTHSSKCSLWTGGKWIQYCGPPVSHAGFNLELLRNTRLPRCSKLYSNLKICWPVNQTCHIKAPIMAQIPIPIKKFWNGMCNMRARNNILTWKVSKHHLDPHHH